MIFRRNFAFFLGAAAAGCGGDGGAAGCGGDGGAAAFCLNQMKDGRAGVAEVEPLHQNGGKAGRFHREGDGSGVGWLEKGAVAKSWCGTSGGGSGAIREGCFVAKARTLDRTHLQYRIAPQLGAEPVTVLHVVGDHLVEVIEGDEARD